MAEEKILSYTDAVKEQKCPACGAPMAFDPATGLMRCAFCGTTAEIEAPEPETAPESAQQGGAEADGKPGQEQGKVEVKPSTTQGFDFASLNDQAVVEDAEALPIYNCVSCGACEAACPQHLNIIDSLQEAWSELT